WKGGQEQHLPPGMAASLRALGGVSRGRSRWVLFSRGVEAKAESRPGRVSGSLATTFRTSLTLAKGSAPARLASLTAGFPSLFRRELVAATVLVRGASAHAGDLTLLFRIHRREAATRASARVAAAARARLVIGPFFVLSPFSHRDHSFSIV